MGGGLEAALQRDPLPVDHAEILGLDAQATGPVGQVHKAEQAGPLARHSTDGVYGVNLHPRWRMEASNT